MAVDTQVVDAEQLIVQHLDLWTSAQTAKSTAGRGSNNKIELTGIKKLRELILELAVRGKLVPQDPNDEPASELLKRIAADKDSLAKAGTVKKKNLIVTPIESDIPYDLPSKWLWVSIDSIGYDFGQKTPASDFTYIDVGSIDNNQGVVLNPTILDAQNAPSRARKIVRKGSIVYSTIRPYLKNIAVIENEYVPEAIASTAFAIIHPAAEMASKFFAYYLRSPTFVRYVESVQTGIAYPAINDKQFFSGVTPLPPLEEQYRIVSKIDELMTLCDQLEQQSYQSIDAHNQLVDTLLQTLMDSANADELASNWQRLSEHFDTLFTTEYSIDALKQTILQLAVMGKLVKQDPTDEPANELLKRIAKEKEALVKAGKIKKQKPLPPITDDEKPFELPEGWEWVKLDLIAKNDKNALKAGPFGSALKKSMYVPKGYKIYGQEQVISGDESIGDYFIDESKFRELESCKVEPGDMLVSLVGTIGKVLILSTNSEPGIINPRLVKISLFSEISREYIAIVLGSRLIQDELLEKSHGSTMNVLNLGLLRDLIFPLPPVRTQYEIVGKVDLLIELLNKLSEKLSKAKTANAQFANTLVGLAAK